MSLPLLVGLVAVAAAPAPWKLASPTWRTANVKADLAEFYADRLAAALRAQSIGVITSSEISALLSQDRQKQLLGCDDDSASCLVELGNALGVDGTLLVSVAKLDQSFHVNLKVLASKDGKVLTETTAEAASESKLLGALEDAAGVVAAALKALRPSEPVSAKGVRRLAWIPAVAGAVLAGGGAGLLVAASGKLGEEKAALNAPVELTVAQAAASQGKTFQTLGWVGVGVGAAALMGAGAMFLFGADAPVTPQAFVTPQGAGFGLAGSWP